MGGLEGGCHCSSKKCSILFLFFCRVAFLFIVITPCAPLRSASIFRPSAHAAQEAFAWVPGWRRLLVPLAPPFAVVDIIVNNCFFLWCALRMHPLGNADCASV